MSVTAGPGLEPPTNIMNPAAATAQPRLFDLIDDSRSRSQRTASSRYDQNLRITSASTLARS
jgi:hypothetical protein